MDKTPAENKAAKTKTEAPAVAYRYRGNGDHFVGIPPRDLTQDEFDALSDADKANVTESSVYEKGGR